MADTDSAVDERQLADADPHAPMVLPRSHSFLRALLDDLTHLRLPVTAAAVVATLVALAEPFGVSIGGDATAKVTGALVALGVVAAYLNDKLGGTVVKTNPATLEHAPRHDDREPMTVDTTDFLRRDA